MQEWDKIGVMNQKGFSQIILLGIVAVLVLAGGGGFLVLREKKMSSSEKTIQREESPQKTEGETQPPKTRPHEKTTQKGEQSEASKKNTSPKIQSQRPQLESIAQGTNTLSNIQQRFAALEGELQKAQEKKSFFSPEHTTRILSDLTNLEAQGYPKSEVERLRKIVYDLSPHLQDQAKQNQVAPSPYMSAAQANCQSNPNPVFTNDITDISKVNYIGPPPTMGAGPSLKTHSYIGTDHVRVPVYAPATMTLESGSHYVGGPYMMEFRVSCEVKVRFGHITEPIEAIKKLLPTEPKTDSRTEELSPVVFPAGEIVGYTTGTDLAGNWDFGVYNSIVRNRYADDLNWNNSTTYTTAVCPFDYFTASLRSTYFSKFNSAALGGNPPHGEPFCKI